MPWCETCSKYYAPTALTVEGTCPTCGRPVGEPPEAAPNATEATPWHFKLLVLATVVYLGWRFVQLFGIA
jgi:hypothetical protein